MDRKQLQLDGGVYCFRTLAYYYFHHVFLFTGYTLKSFATHIPSAVSTLLALFRTREYPKLFPKVIFLSSVGAGNRLR